MAAQSLTYEKSPGVRNALLMLDYPERNIPLFDGTDKWRKIAFGHTAAALIPDELLLSIPQARSEMLTPAVTAIRDSFDDLMIRLTMFSRMMDSGAITKSELNDYVTSHLTLALNASSEHDTKKQLVRNLRLYLQSRPRFAEAQELIKEYCRIDLRATDKDQKEVEHEIAYGRPDWFKILQELEAMMPAYKPLGCADVGHHP